MLWEKVTSPLTKTNTITQQSTLLREKLTSPTTLRALNTSKQLTFTNKNHRLERRENINNQLEKSSKRSDSGSHFLWDQFKNQPEKKKSRSNILRNSVQLRTFEQKKVKDSGLQKELKWFNRIDTPSNLYTCERNNERRKNLFVKKKHFTSFGLGVPTDQIPFPEK